MAMLMGIIEEGNGLPSKQGYQCYGFGCKSPRYA